MRMFSISNFKIAPEPNFQVQAAPLGARLQRIVGRHFVIYWMVSLARSKIDSGIVIPNALAVLRLTTNSN